MYGGVWLSRGAVKRQDHVNSRYTLFKRRNNLFFISKKVRLGLSLPQSSLSPLLDKITQKSRRENPSYMHTYKGNDPRNYSRILNPGQMQEIKGKREFLWGEGWRGFLFWRRASCVFISSIHFMDEGIGIPSSSHKPKEGDGVRKLLWGWPAYPDWCLILRSVNWGLTSASEI